MSFESIMDLILVIVVLVQGAIIFKLDKKISKIEKKLNIKSEE